jgi:ketosteroid isomerase-like protein
VSRVSVDLEAARRRFEDCIATRDRALAETVLDEDFALVLVQPAAVVMSRERWLTVLDDYVVHSLQVAETVVDVAGDLAVVLHRDEMSATVLGEDRSGTFVITDIWRSTADGWRIWRRHSTPLVAGHMPGTQPHDI